MFPFRCSRLNDSISNELRTPSVTMPTRLSSAWVTLINIIFGMKTLPPPHNQPPRSPAVRLALHRITHTVRRAGAQLRVIPDTGDGWLLLPRSVVIERAVTLREGGLDAVLQRALTPGDALRGMPRDAVEERPDHPTPTQTHVLVSLIDEQLHHHQLIHRQQRHALRERGDGSDELLRRHRPVDQSDALGSRAIDRVAGEQQA